MKLADSLRVSLPSNARWSFSAVDLSTGEKLINEGNAADLPMVPGSIIKLLVTAAMLDADREEKISFDTTLSFDGRISENRLEGNLYLKGGGNALLSGKDIVDAVRSLKLPKEITEITGDVVVDDSFFETTGWEQKGSGPAYAPPSALGLELHTVSISVQGGDVRVDPPNTAVRVILNPDGRAGIEKLDDITYEVSGASGGTYVKRRFVLSDPGLYAGGSLITLLKQKGIHVGGSVRRGRLPESATEIARTESKDLITIVKDTNIHSLNTMADNLLLALGAKRFGGPGTKDKGIRALELFLQGLDISGQGIKISDGAGLSSANRITPGQMMAFLTKVSAKQWFQDFYSSLPKSGMDGTLSDTGYINDRIRAKTGRLIDAWCIAGYMERQDNSLIAFSYMVNVPGADLLGKDTANFLLAGLAEAGL